MQEIRWKCNARKLNCNVAFLENNPGKDIAFKFSISANFFLPVNISIIFVCKRNKTLYNISSYNILSSHFMTQIITFRTHSSAIQRMLYSWNPTYLQTPSALKSGQTWHRNDFQNCKRQPVTIIYINCSQAILKHLFTTFSHCHVTNCSIMYTGEGHIT